MLRRQNSPHSERTTQPNGEVGEEERKSGNAPYEIDFAVLPNAKRNNSFLLNLDVSYDFVPTNLPFLRRTRLVFIRRKEQIIEFLRKKKGELLMRDVGARRQYNSDMRAWREKLKAIEKKDHVEQSMLSLEASRPLMTSTTKKTRVCGASTLVIRCTARTASDLLTTRLSFRENQA